MKRLLVIGKPVPAERVDALLKTRGGRIALARHRAAMSQWDLAEKVHRSQSMISLWERGRVTPDTDDVRLLAKALGCTQSYIVTDPNIVTAAA